MKNKPDKRFYIRIKTNTLRIEYKVRSSGDVYSADVINVSAGGMCFLRSSILEKGEIIQIKFAFKSRKVILTGEVIRIEGREVAVKFLDDEYLVEKFVELFNSEFLGLKMKNEKIHFNHEAEIKDEKDNLNDMLNKFDNE